MKKLYSVLAILTTAFCSIEAEDLPEKIEVISSDTAQSGKEEYLMGIEHLENPSLRNEAFPYFQNAVEKGYIPAYVMLGHCYLLGLGVEQDKHEGMQWIQKGADLEDPEAQWTLGLFNKIGVHDLARNDSEAFLWFKKAGEAGHINAQYNVGQCHELGEGVAQDDKESFFWYKKAADQGFKFAQYKLGIYCEEGRGVDQDINEAIQWYTKAADQGHSASRRKLAQLSPIAQD